MRKDQFKNGFEKITNEEHDFFKSEDQRRWKKAQFIS